MMRRLWGLVAPPMEIAISRKLVGDEMVGQTSFYVLKWVKRERDSEEWNERIAR